MKQAASNGPLSLAANDFELFELPQKFDLNRVELDARWKMLQRQVHPDQFVVQGDVEKRMAMQWSVRINEAYQRLKTPLLRAAYICELNGWPIQAENNTSMPTEFLMLQMQWRETMEEADSVQALEALQIDIDQHRHTALSKLTQWLDVEYRWEDAVREVRALMFIERFEKDLNNKIDRLENA